MLIGFGFYVGYGFRFLAVYEVGSVFSFGFSRNRGGFGFFNTTKCTPTIQKFKKSKFSNFQHFSRGINAHCESPRLRACLGKNDFSVLSFILLGFWLFVVYFWFLKYRRRFRFRFVKKPRFLFGFRLTDSTLNLKDWCYTHGRPCV